MNFLHDCLIALCNKETASEVKDWVEAIAVVVGGLWFVTRALLGQGNHNMDLSVECTGRVSEKPDDLAAFKLRVKRGHNGRLKLITLSVDVVEFEAKENIRNDCAIDMLAQSMEGSRAGESIRHGLSNSSQNLSDRDINLPPDDAGEFGFLLQLPKDKAVVCTVTIIGERTFGRRRMWFSGRPRWTCSCVSMPLGESSSQALASRFRRIVSH
jgi:hypothetical protein